LRIVDRWAIAKAQSLSLSWPLIAADSIGLRGRAPAHYPMLKNPDFRIDDNSEDRSRP
jgi:hypothetical protein